MKYYLSLLIFVCVFLVATYKQPSVSFEATYRAALVEAARYTKRSILSLPTVKIVNNKKRFKLIACNNNPSCNSEAVYVSKTRTIYIDGTQVKIETVEGFAVLIHEMVHHLQLHDEVEYNKETCGSVEREAYEAQEHFLNKHGLNLEQKEYRIQKSCYQFQP